MPLSPTLSNSSKRRGRRRPRQASLDQSTPAPEDEGSEERVSKRRKRKAHPSLAPSDPSPDKTGGGRKRSGSADSLKEPDGKRQKSGGDDPAGSGEKPFKRPSFSYRKRNAARREARLATGRDDVPGDNDLAAPHRAPYAEINRSVMEEDVPTVSRRAKFLLGASKEYESALEAVTHDPDKETYHQLGDDYRITREKAEQSLETFAASPSLANRRRLTVDLNNLASNAPGLGPHSTVNIAVSDRLHLQTFSDGTMTPRSKAASLAFPEVAAATTGGGTKIVAPSGEQRSNSLKGLATRDVNASSARIYRGSLAVKGGRLYKFGSNGQLTLVA